MKIIHLSNASRSSTGVTQGLLSLGIDIKVSTSYESFGEQILPATESLQDDMKIADLIFISDAIGEEHSQFLDKYNLWKKVIHYDYRDTNVISSIAYKAQKSFKRSITKGVDRQPAISQNFIIPINHCALNEYYLNEQVIRNKDIGCFFNRNDPQHLGVRRLNLINTIAAHQWDNSYIGCSTGQKNEARLALRERKENNCFFKFIQLQGFCKIVFTAQPSHVEGDNRTWEAMASGALVFMDIMYHPMIKPLIEGKHCFYHNSTKIETIESNIEKAKWFIKHDREREKIAKSGYFHTLKYHRPINRVKQMLGIKMM